MKNKKTYLILLVLCFLFPLFNIFFVVGGNPEDNFYVISESNETTEWTLQGSEITPLEDFHDDINTSYWNLEDVNEIYFEKLILQQYNYLLDNYTTWDYTGDYYSVSLPVTIQWDIFWDGINWWVSTSYDGIIYKYNSDWSYTGDSYYVGAQSAMPQGIFFDGINWWITGVNDKKIFKYNSDWSYTGVFYELRIPNLLTFTICDIFWDGINWYGANSNGRIYKFTSNWDYTGFSYSVRAQDIYPKGIFWDGINWWMVGTTDKVYKYNSDWDYTGDFYDLIFEDLYYKDIFLDGMNWWILSNIGSGYVYKFQASYNISKNYFGNGYMYIQTNTTELISLKSINYGIDYTLNTGDYFEIDFQTNSDSQINLILLKDDIIQKTLILSHSENTNFTNQTIQIYTNEDVEFDQLKISGLLVDTDYVKFFDIKTYKYTITGDYANFIVGEKSTHSIYLTPDIYNLRIFEDGLEVINENITIGSTDYFYVYTPSESTGGGIPGYPLIFLVLFSLIGIIFIIHKLGIFLSFFKHR